MTKTALALADGGPLKTRSVVTSSTEPDVRLLIRVNLEFEGYEVYEVPDAQLLPKLIPVGIDEEQPVYIIDTEMQFRRHEVDRVLTAAGIDWRHVIELARPDDQVLPMAHRHLPKPFSPLSLSRQIEEIRGGWK